MSIANEITRLQGARNKIRNKMVSLGLAESGATLDTLAASVDGIENQGSVSATVQEGDTYTIPQGYHNGTGTVSGVSGGGNYTLQSKTATPTKSQQPITADAGYYGLSDVLVEAIPEAYQDVSSVNALASEVLANKLYVTSTGTLTPGTMPNNGAVSQTLDTNTTSYTIPSGYHNGAGTVKVVTETKSATPSKTAQTISATSGKVLASVSVSAIPSEYQDITGTTATDSVVLDGYTFIGSAGTEITGSMDNNGAINATIDGLSVTSYTIPSGYTSGGSVSLTSDIENALAAI